MLILTKNPIEDARQLVLAGSIMAINAKASRYAFEESVGYGKMYIEEGRTHYSSGKEITDFDRSNIHAGATLLDLRLTLLQGSRFYPASFTEITERNKGNDWLQHAASTLGRLGILDEPTYSPSVVISQNPEFLSDINAVYHGRGWLGNKFRPFMRGLIDTIPKDKPFRDALRIGKQLAGLVFASAPKFEDEVVTLEVFFRVASDINEQAPESRQEPDTDSQPREPLSWDELLKRGGGRFERVQRNYYQVPNIESASEYLVRLLEDLELLDHLLRQDLGLPLVDKS